MGTLSAEHLEALATEVQQLEQQLRLARLAEKRAEKTFRASQQVVERLKAQYRRTSRTLYCGRPGEKVT